MANPVKGEGAFKVAGRDYVLVFDVNALCEVEHLLGLTTDAILGALVAKPPLHVVRALLWGGLRRHHPEVDLLGAGTLMEEAGGAGPALEAIGEAVSASFPPAEAAEGSKDPRTGALAGTGPRS